MRASSRILWNVIGKAKISLIMVGVDDAKKDLIFEGI